jgi:hypothetical protein
LLVWLAAWLFNRREMVRRRAEIEGYGARVRVRENGLSWLSLVMDQRYFEDVVEVNLARMRDYDATQLACFDRLESLVLFSRGVSEQEMATLTRLPHLRSLNLARSRLDWPSLRHLADIESLDELRLGPIPDDAMPYLLGCRSLRILRISNSPQFTDEGLRIVAKLPRLETLHLVQTGAQLGCHWPVPYSVVSAATAPTLLRRPLF